MYHELFKKYRDKNRATLKSRESVNLEDSGIPKEMLSEMFMSDQEKGIAPPPLQKPVPNNAVVIDLVAMEDNDLGDMSLKKAIAIRKSHRVFTEEQLTLKELSFLLWSMNGVKEVHKEKVWTMRTVPSGGARHPIETYLIVDRVENLDTGIYRYLPLTHQLLLIKKENGVMKRFGEKCVDQKFIATSAVIFVWTVVPYRTEWRYSVMSYKTTAIDVGHICQNLHLATESIGAGTCAIASYKQTETDMFLEVDGNDEFALYLAPVGKCSID